MNLSVPNVHVAAAASPRLVSTKYPRRGRGRAATRLRSICAASVRLRAISPSRVSRGGESAWLLLVACGHPGRGRAARPRPRRPGRGDGKWPCVGAASRRAATAACWWRRPRQRRGGGATGRAIRLFSRAARLFRHPSVSACHRRAAVSGSRGVAAQQRGGATGRAMRLFLGRSSRLSRHPSVSRARRGRATAAPSCPAAAASPRSSWDAGAALDVAAATACCIAGEGRSRSGGWRYVAVSDEAAARRVVGHAAVPGAEFTDVQATALSGEGAARAVGKRNLQPYAGTPRPTTREKTGASRLVPCFGQKLDPTSCDPARPSLDPSRPTRYARSKKSRPFAEHRTRRREFRRGDQLSPRRTPSSRARPLGLTYVTWCSRLPLRAASELTCTYLEPPAYPTCTLI